MIPLLGRYVPCSIPSRRLRSTRGRSPELPHQSSELFHSMLFALNKLPCSCRQAVHSGNKLIDGFGQSTELFCNAVDLQTCLG